MQTDFTNKVALVTGGGIGIGRATCLAFASEGAKVVVVDIKPETGEETVNIIKAVGGEAIFIRADVSKEADVEGYVKGALEVFGRIDMFFNNAGIEGALKPVVEYPVEMFDHVMSVNVRGVFLGLKYVLPVMIAQKSGNVVNNSSVGGMMGSPGMVAYTASKHAVNGITKTAALEVARLNIRVNAVCPGATHSPMMRTIEAMVSPDNPEQALKQFETASPDGRYGEPEEVAQLVLFLSSDLSTHITGQAMAIDGGLLAN